MPTYVTLLNWTETGIGSFKGAPERTKEAAALLGLTYDQFRQRYRKYGLGKD